MRCRLSCCRAYDAFQRSLFDEKVSWIVCKELKVVKNKDFSNDDGFDAADDDDVDDVDGGNVNDELINRSF